MHVDPYTGEPRITRYHDSKALGDIVYIHELDRTAIKSN